MPNTTGEHSALPRLAVFISGGGSTMANLARLAAAGQLRCAIPLVVASRTCPGVDLARSLGLHTLVLPGVIPAAALADLLAQHNAHYLALAGYLRLLDLPDSWTGRAVNIHPALLPAFGGPGMHGRHVHAAVLAAGCKLSGCTVHFVDRQFDTGPIILQRSCPVLDDDTPDSLAARVQALETSAYPDALNLLLAGRLRIEGRRVHTLPAAEHP